MNYKRQSAIVCKTAVTKGHYIFNVGYPSIHDL